MQDAAAYVSARQGRPYTSDEHCWWLVRETQRDLFGRDLPAVLIDEVLGPRELVRAFHGHPERQQWQEVSRPQHGGVVLMHKPGAHARAIHAGIFLDLDGGGVFHTDEDHGVTFDTLFDLSVRNWRCEFYLPR